MLGQILGGGQPQVAAQPDPQLKSEWQGWMDNPANKAALLSFGLNLMNGGWGGPGAQFAQAAGKGVEAAVGTQEAMDAEASRQEGINRDQANKQADRDLRRELANKGAGSAREQARMDRLSLAFDRQENTALTAIEKIEREIAEARQTYGADADVTVLEQQLANRRQQMEGIQRKRDAMLGISTDDAGEGDVTRQNMPAEGAGLVVPGAAETANVTRQNSGAQDDEAIWQKVYNSWSPDDKALFDSGDEAKKAKVKAAQIAKARKEASSSGNWLTRAMDLYQQLPDTTVAPGF